MRAESNRLHEHWPRAFGDHFRAERILKEGLGMVTQEGVDLATGAAVVIKTVRAEVVSPTAQMRLEHMIATLGQARGSALAAPLHMGDEAGLLYVVAPYVPGDTLRQRLRERPLSLDEVLTVARCLFAGLHEAHGRGVLHGDIKPENVIVRGHPVAQVTLTDFGLSRRQYLEPVPRELLARAARYTSPEGAGLLREPVDERSDLYCAGIVLFECLVGRPPFEGDDVGAILRQHLSARPPSLRSQHLRVPAALDAVIAQLLHKEPRARYQTAAGVVADLDEIIEAHRRGESEPRIVVGLRDRRHTLGEPPFIGRAAELGALDMWRSLAAQGHGGLVTVEAASGGGKTRLLDESARRGQDEGAWVLRGQGLNEVARRPFQVLAGAVGDLVATLRYDAAAAGALRERMGDRLEDLCAVWPQLADVCGPVPRAPRGTEEYGEARTLSAVAALLDVLGTAERPALLLLDDCQWADGVTLKLLDYWQRHAEESRTARYVLVVAAFRSEDVPDGHVLRDVPVSAHVRLPAFRPEEVRQLIHSIAGSVPEAALTTVEQLAAGSPFMVSAVLHGLVESGALMDEPEGWSVAPRALAAAQSSRHAALFLAHRLESLPATVLRLLTAGAVLGKQFDLDFAAALAEQPSATAVAAIDEARKRHIVWQGAWTGPCSFVHDKLRETLLALLDDEQRRLLHRRAAEQIAASDAARAFDLAYHYAAAGMLERALPHALAAAEQARAQHDLAAAEEQYRIAQRGAALADAATRYRVAAGLGEVLMFRSQYDEATEELQRARALAPDRAAQAHIASLLGQVAAKRGESAEAALWLERALADEGMPVPRTALGFQAALARELVVQAAHVLVPDRLRPRRPLSQADADLRAARLYRRLVHAYAYQGLVKASWSVLRMLNLVERYPETEEMAQAYSDISLGICVTGRFALGTRYAKRSLAIRRKRGDVWGIGQSLYNYAATLSNAGRHDEALPKYREALHLLERAGDRWEINFARWNLALTLIWMGDLRGAAREGRRVYEDGLQVDDRSITSLGLSAWAAATNGAIPEDLIRGRLTGVKSELERANILLAEGIRLLSGDRVHDAAQVLDEAVAAFSSAGMPRSNFTLPVLQWRLTALRRAAEQSRLYTPHQGRSVLQRAQRVADDWRRIARTYPNYLPHALREQAQVLALADDPERALPLLDEALAVAARRGMRHERAQTAVVRGRIRLQLGQPGAADELAQATAALRALEPARDDESRASVTLSLIDRFETVIEAGRRIAAALSTETIFEAVQQAALGLLRAEHCRIVQIVPGAGSIGLDPDVGGLPVSALLVERAVEAGHSLTSDALDGFAAIDMGAGSALCAPIFVRGKVACCLYAVHGRLSGLFGEEEIQLAEYLASLGGAALENAEDVAAVEALTRELEYKKGEERFRALIEHASDIITILDAEAIVRFGSPSLERVLGYAPRELIGARLENYVHPEDAPALAALIGAGEAAVAREMRFRHRDQSWRILEVVSTNLLHDPAVQGIVINARDISERKRAEELQGALLRQELTHAWEIQRRLLPTALPYWPGRLELAVRFKPARETSGDFYDVVELPRAERDEGLPPLQIAVGDVAGKGIAASLVMALTRTMLRAVAQPVKAAEDADRAGAGRRTTADPAAIAVPSPAVTMQSVARLLNQDVGRKDFVACALAVVEVDSRVPSGARMRLTNAAQVPPLLCRDGRASELVPPGERLPLGVLPAVAYDEMIVALQPGDVVLFSTDGLPEAQARSAHVGEVFGFERLAASAAYWSANAADAAAVAAGIWQDVTAWSGEAPAHDDMTLLVLRIPRA